MTCGTQEVEDLTSEIHSVVCSPRRSTGWIFGGIFCSLPLLTSNINIPRGAKQREAWRSPAAQDSVAQAHYATLTAKPKASTNYSLRGNCFP